MAKGFYISKSLGILGILLGVAALCTIVALSVVYAQEKNRNAESFTEAPEIPVMKLRPYFTPNKDGLYIFEGSSTVLFTCKEATNVIIIHSKKLNYTRKQEHMVVLTELVERTEYLVVHLKGYLEVGHKYEMDTEFQGELADDLAGFYCSEYMDGNVKKVVATTQMQAADARKSFPCFDEPAMKAQFSITLIHPKDYVALSNMLPKGPSAALDGEPDWSVTEFEMTPKMSTYLLAYIVSEFTKVETQSPNNVLLRSCAHVFWAHSDPGWRNISIRIWARPSAIDEGHGDYALNVTGPILNFFAGHYDTPYPLQKSSESGALKRETVGTAPHRGHPTNRLSSADQIGLPDFNAGAMENWGLVTCRENALLFDPVSSSSTNKEWVVTVIAHELAHQWFGNLVTVEWWNDLWLNEGFASYLEYLGADYAEPTWNLKDLIVLNDVHCVMAVDALASSHPLSTPAEEINTPSQISELFDAISYSKGASVLRMLSSFLTEDLFKKGLASYLHTFEYQNTVYQDLWHHLQEAVDNQSEIELPDHVSNIMDCWILQMGFPVITVDTSKGEISQEHFLLDPESNVTRPSQFNYLWIVPITSIRNGIEQKTYWLQSVQKAQHEYFRTSSDNEWVLLNLNVTDYYLVNYDESNWKKIQTQLRQICRWAIPVINRAQVIHDSFNLASAGRIPVTLALDNTLFLIQETEYMPWEAALSSLNYFKLMFDRFEVYGPMKNYLKKQVYPLFTYYRNLTNFWTQRPPILMEQYNQVNAISTACANGIEECETMVTNLFKEWMTNPTINPIHPNLRSTVYCNAISQGGEEEWEFAWHQFRNATLVNEADKLRAALACTNEVWLLNRYLSYTLNPDYIRKQDTVSTITSITNNVIGQTLVWDFVRSNWKKLFEDYGGGSFSFSNLIQAMTRRFSTEYELQQLERFKMENMDTGFDSGTRALEQALEKTKANIKWSVAGPPFSEPKTPVSSPQ
ncbi:aminopeptidase N-like [Callospermophilus lateralis]|uniref:aminopeptidase N-like n=1 Tax=Callospermophilus lateralis TaxID=76772 RepID=UPI004053BAD9